MMNELKGKLYRTMISYRIGGGVSEYVYVANIYKHDDGTWWFDGINKDGTCYSDRTVFLNYLEEVTNPAEIILFSPNVNKK